jgi:hypothetical protein
MIYKFLARTKGKTVKSATDLATCYTQALVKLRFPVLSQTNGPFTPFASFVNPLKTKTKQKKKVPIQEVITK